MSAPERIWAWTWKYNIARVHGTRTWVDFAPKPIDAIELDSSPNPLSKKFWFPENKADFQDVNAYILATPEALAVSPEVQAMIAAASAQAIEGVIKAMHNDGVTVISLAALERTVANIRNRGDKP